MADEQMSLIAMIRDALQFVDERDLSRNKIPDSLKALARIEAIISVPILSRLAWLCDREVDRLQKFSDEHAVHAECADDIAEADNDRTFWVGVAKMLRECRDG